MSMIKTRLLKRFWDDAQNHPEWATTRLWEYIFNHIIFKDEKWAVSSQQPPTHKPGELRRVDLVVEMDSDNNDGTVRTLLFMEAKRASASTSDIQEVEYQAFTAACAYYVETGQKHVWTMTCVGSTARLWIFNEESTYLIPYIPAGLGLAEKSEYLEINTDGQVIVDALNYIKKHPTPPRELLDMPPSPRPAHTTLPTNWHDNEVVQLDTQHQRSGGWASAPAAASASTGGMGFGPNPDYHSAAGPQCDEWAAEGEVWVTEEGLLDTEPPFTNPQERQGGYY